jgi:hypothetical protein
MAQGQINRGSNLGETIYNIAKQDSVQTIVEIGTWNGAGSTKCIREAVLDKARPCKVLSIEAWKSMYDVAIQNNQPAIVGFEIVHGRIVELSDLNWFDHSTLSEDEKRWLADDIANYNQCPNVMDKIPAKIDLLILDGGEFSSHEEFHKLIDRSNFVILDDTFQGTRKFKAIREMILSNTDRYEIIGDITNDRNGYMVLRNKQFNA